MNSLPYDKQAERATLGSLLLTKGDIPQIYTILKPENFYDPKYGMIFASIHHLWSMNEPADTVTLANYLEEKDELKRIGGAIELVNLLEETPSASSGIYYARIVAELARKRNLILAGQEIVNYGNATSSGLGIEEAVDKAQQLLLDVATETVEDYHTLEESLPPTLEEIFRIANGEDHTTGIMTGIDELDRMTNGLRPGQMIIVAARPAVGKSTFALDVMRNCSLRYNKKSVLFSLEMSTTEVMMRLLSAEFHIPLTNIIGGHLTQPEMERLIVRGEEIVNAPLFIDDSPNLTMTDIRAKARRIQQQDGLDLIVVDYLQLMTSGKRVESRQQEVSEFSRQLKLLAKELEVPVIAVAQLNRNSEQRLDKRPQVADIRESGSLEQDADIVLLLHRPEAFGENESEGAEIIVGKHRGGPTGSVPVVPQLHFSRFVNPLPDIR